MAIPVYECVKCEKKFSPPNWLCETGEKHAVAPKIFFSPVKSLRMYVTDERMETLEDGRKKLIPARFVEFTAGRFVTSDPEDQWALDRQTAQGSLINEEQWKARNYKPEDILKDENEKLRERLAKYENPLLESVKQSKEARKSA